MMSACEKSPKSLPTPPTDIQYGKAGEVPTEVYANYDWVIVSKDRYFR